MVIWCFGDSSNVIRTDGPVDLLQAHPMLLGEFSTSMVAVYCVPSIADPLISSVKESVISEHKLLPPFPASPEKQSLVYSNDAAPRSWAHALKEN